MIQLLFLIIISAVVLSIAFFGFRDVPLTRRMVLAGGALAAATIGVLMQSSFSWYMSLLAIVAVSLLAALIYMKVLEKEQKEIERDEEERKARRKELISTASSLHSAPEPTPIKNEVADQATNVRETIQVTEKISMPEPVKMPQMEKEPEKEPERVKELVGAKPFGMQSIKPVGKEDQGEQ